MPVRIIPRLDIKNSSLVKGIHLEGFRVLGRPERFARQYYEQGADELLCMDIVASLYQRNTLLEIVGRIARELYIPFTAGGGLRTLDDIRAVLDAGADRVTLNTAAIRRPELIVEAVRVYGSSTILLSVEAIRQPDGRYEAYTENGRERTGLDAVAWAVRATELGVGEVLVTSIDREGTGQGFDLELTETIARAVAVPVIACGGAGTAEHVHEVLTRGRADAVCLGSILHYNVVKSHGADHGLVDGNPDFLRKPRGIGRVQDTTIPVLKSYLMERDIACRPAAVASPV